MKSKTQLVSDSLKLAKESVASTEILYFSLEKGEYLANLYQADQDIVKVAICLMDIKLQEAKRQGDIKEHIKMASSFAKQFLKEYDITDEERAKIINGIEAHHGKIPFTCIESEICANADCYIFIHPRGVFTYLNLLAKRNMSLKDQIEQLKSKLEEKYAILTLDCVKEELGEYYQSFLLLFDQCLNDLKKENDER